MTITHKRAAIVAISASATLFAGIAVGLAVGSRPASNPKASSTAPALRKTHALEETRRPPAPSAPDGSSQVGGAGEVPAPSDPIRIAQELWEMMTSTDWGGKGLTQPDRRARLRELRPELAPFFIRKFRESTPRSSTWQVALEMAMCCGGPDAASLLEELESGKADRFTGLCLKVAVSVLSHGSMTPRPREFPVGPSLLARTRVLLSSGESEDRVRAAIFLGYVEPAEAVPTLTNLMQSDADLRVRQVAILNLGRIGDAATLAWLRAHRDSLADALGALQKPDRSPDGSVTLMPKHYFTRSIDDAIEELEERLQKK